MKKNSVWVRMVRDEACHESTAAVLSRALDWAVYGRCTICWKDDSSNADNHARHDNINIGTNLELPCQTFLISILVTGSSLT